MAQDTEQTNCGETMTPAVRPKLKGKALKQVLREAGRKGGKANSPEAQAEKGRRGYRAMLAAAMLNADTIFQPGPNPNQNQADAGAGSPGGGPASAENTEETK